MELMKWKRWNLNGISEVGTGGVEFLGRLNQV